MLVIWLAGGLAAAAPDDAVLDLAPGPEELDQVQRELEARLVEAESIGKAVARLQGDASTAPPKGAPCADPVHAERLRRLRAFSEGWHDAVQRARVQADRLARAANAPTVALVVDEERREAVGSLLARTDHQTDAWLELVAWFGRTAPRACEPAPLTAFPGLPSPGVLALGETEPPTVALVAEGYACVEGRPPVQGPRLVLLEGRACFSETSRCWCEPVSVLPGAVLAPPPPEPPPAPEAPPPAPEAPPPAPEAPPAAAAEPPADTEASTPGAR